MRESLGTRLRRQREAQKVTLASIAAATKISSALFSGLERDDVTTWPPGLYRRAFVRAYAEAVGLDPDAVCREFAEQFPEAAGRPVTARLTLPMSAHLGEWHRVLSSPKDPIARVDDLIEEARRSTGQGIRWQAAMWDVCGLLIIAGCALALAGRFWAPLGLAALGYHLGGTLLLGKSPTLWWFERRVGDEALGATPPLGETASLR